MPVWPPASRTVQYLPLQALIPARHAMPIDQGVEHSNLQVTSSPVARSGSRAAHQHHHEPARNAHDAGGRPRPARPRADSLGPRHSANQVFGGLLVAQAVAVASAEVPAGLHPLAIGVAHLSQGLVTDHQAGVGRGGAAVGVAPTMLPAGSAAVATSEPARVATMTAWVTASAPVRVPYHPGRT